MSTIDITKSFCHIKKVLDILKSQNTKCNRRLVQSSRHSDAFVYISDGACTYTFSDGREQLARRGDILYLSHKASYTMYIHDANFKFIFCNFEFDTDIKRDCFIVTAPNPSHAENIFLKLWNTYKANKPYSEADILSMLYSIYAIVTRTKNADLIQKPQTNRITELKEYIDVNYSDLNLSVASLADKADMSEVYFRKLFKSKYGETPSKYIISTRLQKARELMKYELLTLSDIALQCGFSSQQYFCRIFKKNLGLTPTEYATKQK